MTDPKKDVDDAEKGVEQTVEKNDPTRVHTDDGSGNHGPTPPPPPPPSPPKIGG